MRVVDGNESSGWEWECDFSFELKNSSDNSKSIDEKYKDRIWKNPDLGLFGLLKKDVTTYKEEAAGNKWNKQGIKQVKIDFIRKCGYQRTVSKNKEISNKKVENSEIKVDVPKFVFKVEDDKLVPEDKDVFESWFKEEYKKLQHQT